MTYSENEIRCITIKYEKRGSQWHETSREKKTVDRQYYKNTVDSIKFFRNLGGIETYRSDDVYHIFIDSISPDGNIKITREFIF